MSLKPPNVDVTPVLVENRAQYCEALAAAQAANVPLITFTPVGFAGYAGVLFAHEMWHQARAYYPEHPATLWVDCGDDPALVQEGLQCGLTHMVFSGDPAYFVKLSEIATQHPNAHIRQDRPVSFSAIPLSCA